MEYNDLPLARRKQIEAARKKVKEKNLLGCLLVENVGVITQAEVEVRKLTLFIGENNTGKSTLAKLLEIFMGEPINRFIHIIGLEFFLSKLWNYDIDSFVNNKSFILWFSPFLGEFIFFGNGDFLSSDNKKYEVDQSVYKSLGLWLKKESELEKNGHELSEDFMLSDSRLSGPLKSYPELDSIYIPAERELVSTIAGATFSFMGLEVPIPKAILYFAMKFERIKAERKSIDIDFLNVSYEWSNNSHQIRIDEQKTVPINVASSGVKAVTPAYVTLSSYRQRSTSFVVIEEPENNLHPLSQKAFVNKLSEFCLQGDSQFLVVTTHSPYILSSFNNQIQAGTLAAKKPDLVGEIEKIIPRGSWLNFADVSAYELKAGSAYSILDEEWQGVMTETIDQASDVIGDEYDRLLDLKYQDGDNE